MQKYRSKNLHNEKKFITTYKMKTRKMSVTYYK